MATIKYKGVRIVKVKVVSYRYEVRDPTGHVMAKRSTPGAARGWIDGYLTMADEIAKTAATKPVRKRAKKVAAQESLD
jgi:hypothetical protein